MLACKHKALFVKGVVIANGITDSQGDCLNSEDIKKIFTTFNNQSNFEIGHNGIPIKEVSLIENYINTADETIGNFTVPRGSWCCVIRVDDPEIQKLILDGELRGLSLSNRISEKCDKGLQGTVRYEDIPDMECVIPLFISLVQGGANGYPLSVMDYEAYIKKSNKVKGVKTMAFDLKEGLKNLLKQAEEETKSETKNEEQNESEIKKAEECNEEDEKKNAEVNKSEPAPVDEKALEEKITAIVEKILKEKKEEKEANAKEENNESESNDDTPKITKSSRVIDEKVVLPKANNYYEMTNRDPVTGVKIRK